MHMVSPTVYSVRGCMDPMIPSTFSYCFSCWWCCMGVLRPYMVKVTSCTAPLPSFPRPERITATHQSYAPSPPPLGLVHAPRQMGFITVKGLERGVGSVWVVVAEAMAVAMTVRVAVAMTVAVTAAAAAVALVEAVTVTVAAARTEAEALTVAAAAAAAVADVREDEAGTEAGVGDEGGVEVEGGVEGEVEGRRCRVREILANLTNPVGPRHKHMTTLANLERIFKGMEENTPSKTAIEAQLKSDGQLFGDDQGVKHYHPSSVHVLKGVMGAEDDERSILHVCNGTLEKPCGYTYDHLPKAQWEENRHQKCEECRINRFQSNNDGKKLKPQFSMYYLGLEDTLNSILSKANVWDWFTRPRDTGPGTFYSSEAGQFMKEKVGESVFNDKYAVRVHIGIDWVQLCKNRSVGIIVLKVMDVPDEFKGSDDTWAILGVILDKDKTKFAEGYMHQILVDLRDSLDPEKRESWVYLNRPSGAGAARPGRGGGRGVGRGGCLGGRPNRGAGAAGDDAASGGAGAAAGDGEGAGGGAAAGGGGGGGSGVRAAAAGGGGGGVGAAAAAGGLGAGGGGRPAAGVRGGGGVDGGPASRGRGRGRGPGRGQRAGHQRAQPKQPVVGTEHTLYVGDPLMMLREEDMQARGQAVEDGLVAGLDIGCWGRPIITKYLDYVRTKWLHVVPTAHAMLFGMVKHHMMWVFSASGPFQNHERELMRERLKHMHVPVDFGRRLEVTDQFK
ncbi:hypothetical protein V8C86DRAFT_3032962 [Haematococcus lacustris]